MDEKRGRGDEEEEEEEGECEEEEEEEVGSCGVQPQFLLSHFIVYPPNDGPAATMRLTSAWQREGERG